MTEPIVRVISRSGDAARNQLQRKRKNKKKQAGSYYEYSVKVPSDVTTLDAMYRLFERVVYGKDMNLEWSCNDYCDMSKNTGNVVGFLVHKSTVESQTDPEIKKQREESKKEYLQLAGKEKGELTDEVNRRYYEVSGDKPGSRIKKGEEGKARMWEQQLSDVLGEQKRLEELPPEIKELMGSEASFKPRDYQQLLRIVAKLKQFGPADFAVYKLLTIRATDNLDLFEQSVDVFLARKEELKKALEEELAKGGRKEPTLQEALDEQLKDLDKAGLGKMSEEERYRLALEKTSQLTAAQLKYMKEHPGEVAKDFLKSATLMNTPETFSAIGKDIQEAANGDANTFARWAAGTGAGAKLSGWLLAVAGVLYVASWLTGVGELATIAAGAAILLGTTITLSAVESELRIKAASQAKTPEEFERNVKLAAAARTNVIVAVSLIVVAALLHFTAKAFFPEQIQNIKTSLKNFRERIRLKGSVHDLKPKIRAEMAQRKTDLIKSGDRAKKNAADSAADLDGLSTEQFVERLEKGDGGFLDQSKLPADRQVNYRELLRSPEGRAAIEQYKQRLVDALKNDVPAEIDKLTQEYASKIDEFVKDAEGAKNHDELTASIEKLEGALTEEHLKQFVGERQTKLTEEKLAEASAEAHKELVASVKEGIITRAKARIARSDKFELLYTEAELEAIISKGKELALSDGTIEHLIYTGSRKAKPITAEELMRQMENWVTVVSRRGFPYRFANLAEFKAFSKDLLDGLRSTGLPVDDVRVQGSSLRTPTARDVDLAVFVDQSVFDKLLVDRYHMRIATKAGTKVPLRGKSHEQLVELAADIESNPGNYNAQGGTFQNAFNQGIISSKSDIFKPLKDVQADIASKYPTLNIEAISVEIKGGAFEILPDMPVAE